MDPGAGVPSIHLAGCRATGILLVHGLTGSPADVSPLAEALNAAGYAVLAPCLPGHGGDGLSLRGRRWREWYETARAAAHQLTSPRLVVCGLSLGALLATVLADRERERISALIALAPALEIRHQWLLPLASFLAPVLPRSALRRSWAAPEPGSAPTQGSIPVWALAELYRAQRAARRALPRLRLPALIIHSRRDPTCPLRSALRFERGLAGAAATLVVLERSGHVLPLDSEREAVAVAVVEFCNRIDHEEAGP